MPQKLHPRLKDFLFRALQGPPKDLYRALRRSGLLSSPLLTPAKPALEWYRRHIKQAAPSPRVHPKRKASNPSVDAFLDGPPAHDRANELRRKSHSANAYATPEEQPFPHPRASITALIPNRNGEAHLRKLFESFLLHEATEGIQLWVLDHGSTDGSLGVLREFEDQLPLKLVDLDDDDTFSASINRLARLAQTDYLLLLDSDVVFTRPIIRRLADYLRDPEVRAAAPMLRYPKGHRYSDGVQHAGIKFYPHFRLNGMCPYNLSTEHGLTEIPSGPERFPAATGALLCLRRDEFIKVGGLDEGYNDGMADIDLCLRLRQQLDGDILVDCSLSAVHDEDGAQLADASTIERRRVEDHDRLQRRWGFQLRRALLRDRIEQTRFLSDEGLRIGLAVTEDGPDAQAGDAFTAQEFGAALKKAYDCELRMMPRTGDWNNARGFDVVLSLLHNYQPKNISQAEPGLIRAAWARNWFQKWPTEQYDLCFASSDLARQFFLNEKGVQSELLRIATNPARFSAGRTTPKLKADVCFTGSRWNQPREIEERLLPKSLHGSLAIWGRGWEGTSLEDWARGFIPYSQLPDVYASTRIVIDSANWVTGPWASVNSRVFDALGAGNFVVTDGELGAKEVFGELLPTYHDASSLTALVNEALDDPDTAAKRQRMLQRKVLEEHTYEIRARQFIEGLKQLQQQSRRIAIKVPAPKNDYQNWGDYYLALALQRSFVRLGHRVRIDLLQDWNTKAGLSDDVAIVLRGLSVYEPKPQQINLMWNISHPDKISDAEYERYDHVFVASLSYAEELSRLNVPVTPLLQATDPDLFFPPTAPTESAEEILFIGNSRRQLREIVKDAIDADLPLSVYGGLWDGLIPERYVQGTHIENEALSAHYAGAGVLLNDHWPTMRERGFISNRLFDATAAGAVVVSDEVAGLDDLFDGLVRTYSGGKEALAEVVADARAHREAERPRRLALAERVRQEHSFDRRAAQIIEVVEELMQAPVRRPLRTPSREQ